MTLTLTSVTGGGDPSASPATMALDAALDGVESGFLIIDGYVFDVRGDATITATASGTPRRWDRDAALVLVGMLTGMAVFAALRGVVFG